MMRQEKVEDWNTRKGEIGGMLPVRVEWPLLSALSCIHVKLSLPALGGGSLSPLTRLVA